MNFVAADFRRQLRGRNEFNPNTLAGGGGPGATFHRVVIRQGHGLQAVFLGLGGQFFWRVSAVGKESVQMKVGKHTHLTPRAGRINSLFTLSRIPFTNLPLSWVENFLAISTASLMLTTGGMSSRCSISKMARRSMLRSTAAIRCRSQF